MMCYPGLAAERWQLNPLKIKDSQTRRLASLKWQQHQEVVDAAGLKDLMVIFSPLPP